MGIRETRRVTTRSPTTTTDKVFLLARCRKRLSTYSKLAERGIARPPRREAKAIIARAAMIRVSSMNWSNDDARRAMVIGQRTSDFGPQTLDPDFGPQASDFGHFGLTPEVRGPTPDYFPTATLSVVSLSRIPEATSIVSWSTVRFLAMASARGTETILLPRRAAIQPNSPRWTMSIAPKP